MSAILTETFAMATGSPSSRVALVTGAAKGIGRACVEKFVAAGWSVGAIDVDRASLDALARRHADRVACIAADVCDQKSMAQALDTVEARLGRPAAGINVAGIYPMSSLDTATPELYRRIFDVNVLGTVLASQAAARRMPDGGAIVNFASVNAFLAKPEQLLYSAAKAAVVHLTKSMAADLAARRIRVNAIAPGPVDTEGLREIAGRMAQVVQGVPLGRAAAPQEIADLVLWLVEGTGAQYITGETIMCSGGMAMR